ncbi:MAG: glyoxylate/hydroxypyruvate reductase A [Pseudomonadota bacterium]
MSINVLFAARPEHWKIYKPLLHQALEQRNVTARVTTDCAPDQADYLVYSPTGGLTDFTPYTNTKVVLSLWAGVERIVINPTLTQPLTRMVDDGLERGMVEWVTGHVLRYHLGMDAHLQGQDGEWRTAVPPLAPDRCVTILGLGALGQACGHALAQLGFDVSGWSRSVKDIPGLRCLSGEDGLALALSTAQILVLLLPLTDATENLINPATLGQLPNGAFLINPGRGPLIDDVALLAALDHGQLAHATLDVFRQEPLPPDHPFWAHPKVTVTPHIASETRPETASQVVAENIRRSEAGEPLLYLVDRALGY